LTQKQRWRDGTLRNHLKTLFRNHEIHEIHERGRKYAPFFVCFEYFVVLFEF